MISSKQERVGGHVFEIVVACIRCTRKESLSADSSSVESFRERFLKIVADEGLTRDQVLNCDETGLNFLREPSFLDGRRKPRASRS